MPMKSANCNGPIGTLVPFFMMSSISSLPPTPVSRQMTASLIYGMRIRLARKPGESVDCDGILPIFLTNARAVSTVDCDVCRPVIISTPFCTGTGFIKCVLMTRDGPEKSVGSSPRVAAAILVMEMEDVLVARMVCGGQTRASSAKIDAFKDGISGTASMTKSAVERSVICVDVERRSREAVASACVSLFLVTSFARSWSYILHTV